MTTYFVAGYSSLPNTSERWVFYRLVSWTDDDTPHEFLNKITTDLDNSPENYLYVGMGRKKERGTVTITAFNKV